MTTENEVGRKATENKTENNMKKEASARAATFHARAGNSQAEARKTLIALSLGGVGVFYNRLAQPPIAGARWLVFSAMVAMAIAVGFGLLAWKMDALWAYQVAEEFDHSPDQISPVLNPWHGYKKLCDNWQQVFFALSVILSLIHVFRLL